MWGSHRAEVRPSLGRSLAMKAARVRTDLAFAWIDGFLVICAYLTALGIRMIDPGVNDRYWSDIWAYLAPLAILHVAANILAGAYGHVWEHASIAEARQVLLSNLSVLGVAGMFVAVHDSHPIPLSTLVMGAAFSTCGMGLVRFRSRMFSYRRLASGVRSKVLVVGTNRAAAVFAREAAPKFDVVGFISVDDSHSQRWLAGLPILGRLQDIVQVVAEEGVHEVVVVGSSDALVRSVVDSCINIDVRLRILRDPAELMEEREAAVDVRDIEVSDLLPRPEIHTDLLAVRNII